MYLYYNDHFMALCAFLGTYFMSHNKPNLAAFFIALGISIKTGILLILPAFLGWTQYHYGVAKLTIVLAILVLWQFIPPLPFIWTPAASLLGFKNPALTETYTYLTHS